jgi:hypothetical protein
VKVRLPGTVVQGLFRPEYLERAGVHRRVLMPDRLLLAELAALGEIRHVSRRLWSRRMRPRSSHSEIRARQRTAIYPDGPPFWARLPWLVVHGSALLWGLVLMGNARPELGRAEGVRVATAYVRADVERSIRVAKRRRRRLQRVTAASQRADLRTRKRLRRLRKQYRRRFR